LAPVHDSPELQVKINDAMLVWPHRDPVKAVASVTSLTGNRNWVTSDHPRITGYEQYSDPERVAAMLECAIDWIEKGQLPRERVCNVQYGDIVAEPLATVEQIYHYFGIEFTPQARQAIEAYVNANPREARPPHRYTLGSDELVSRERQIFQRYSGYFQIPYET